MGYARIEGALTAKEVHTIFKIHEINGSRRVPATTTDLLTVGERTYAYSTTMFRMENLIAMGYVRSRDCNKTTILLPHRERNGPGEGWES